MKIEEIKLSNIDFGQGNRVFALIGGDNPTGSIKDVTVFNMLQSYKKDGSLKKGTTIIEATSGNTGISLAYYQKEFGYKCIIVMPTSMSKERREMIAQYGAELVLVEGGMAECNMKANELHSSIPNSFIFNQFKSHYNPLAHYLVTGPFIFFNIKKPDLLFAGVGTGGTISGTSKYLKERVPTLRTIGIEPLESPLLTQGKSGPHLIQGIGANFVPSTLISEYIDEIEDVCGPDSIAMARLIRDELNIDVGISSGAALLGVINYLKRINVSDKNIIVIFPDKGDRYSW